MVMADPSDLGHGKKKQIMLRTHFHTFINVSEVPAENQTDYCNLLSEFQSIGPLLWADVFSKPICPYVCLCVCVSVCVSVRSFLKYRLKVFLPPLPKVRYPEFLEIWNPLGKEMKKNGLRFENFY